MKPGGGSAEFVPERGDVLWLQLGPTAGHEQSGRRPSGRTSAVVLSPSAYNAKAGVALICPIAPNSKGYPFEVPMPNDSQVSGVILADHLRSVNCNWRVRRSEFAATVPAGVILEIVAKVHALLHSDLLHDLGRGRRPSVAASLAV